MTTIKLSKTAQWASSYDIAAHPRLRNGYRERFAFVAGRRFRISAESLDSLWWVEEVDAEGEALWDTPDGKYDYRVNPDLAFGDWARNLATARQKILDAVTGVA